MKVIFLIFTVFIYVHGNENEWPTFYYYPSLDEEPTKLQVNDLLKPPFAIDKQTIFIIHGYKSYYKEEIYQETKYRLLSNTKNNNIIMVDWSQGASPLEVYGLDYPLAVKNTGVTAKRTAKFIKENGMNLTNVYCVGHSLGAHTCGQLGKELDGKLGRITGLDPAGPFFPPKSEIRLAQSDALFVDVIHTDRVLGNRFSVGDQDFYVNWPPSSISHQPLCKTALCDHIIAVVIYANSTSPDSQFTSTLCNAPNTDEFGFIIGCDTSGSEAAPLGYYASSKATNGDYFVQTDDQYFQP